MDVVKRFSRCPTWDTGVTRGINFTDTGVTTFPSLTQLATKFNVTDDHCGGGSPRFQINFGSQNVFVYLGPSPTFTGCTPNTLVDSGNLSATTIRVAGTRRRSRPTRSATPTPARRRCLLPAR